MVTFLNCKRINFLTNFFIPFLMYIYKISDSDNSDNLQNNRIQSELKDEIPNDYFILCTNNSGIPPYVERDEVSQFSQEFREGIENKSLSIISNSLNKFITQISYLDPNRNLCRRELTEDALIFIETTPIIIDDIIFCLQNVTALDIILFIFDIIDYFSSSDLFKDDIISHNGIDYIMSHIKIKNGIALENQELLLKSLQILETFSMNQKIYQKLVSSQFTSDFFQICDALFVPNSNFYKLDEMIYTCSLLFKRIVRIVSLSFGPNTEEAVPLLLNEAEVCQLQTKIYDLLKNFFIHSQKEAIQTFIFLHFDHNFVENIFPFVLQMIPQMTPTNRIETYKLITVVYSNQIIDYCKNLFIENNKIPWNFLNDSILSNSKVEVFVALKAIQSLFRYDKEAIFSALKNKVADRLKLVFEKASFDVKEKVLFVIKDWLNFTDIDNDRMVFVNKEFVDLLFDNFESHENELKDQIFSLINLIKALGYKDGNLQNYIDLSLDEYGYT